MPQTHNRLLTKSRFKLALDCPTKLYYTRKPEYENQQVGDTFLEALAQGGFQVEELARLHYPEGIAILGEDYNYEALAARTHELLQQEEVVIFEAAFLHDGYFIRTDILVKKGTQIQLIEVKAKSVGSRGHDGFSVTGGWSAYLYDVAFQQYVIYNQLKTSDEPDREALMQFIQHISHSTRTAVDNWTGARDMIDLYKLVTDYYYDLQLGGSNSIKAVLPAVLNSSAYLRVKYSQPLERIDVSSLNFAPHHRFIQEDEAGRVVSPYKNLPPLFDYWDAEQLDAAVTNIEGISDGGAALTAYGKLQFEAVTPEERREIENGLLRYCELDTLAMVMILEYFREVIKEN